MRQRNWLIGVGIATFVLGIAAQLPAHVALRLVAPGAEISGSHGTIWSGSVDTMTLGAFRLSQTEWSLRPLALLQLRLGAVVSTTWANGKGQGTVEAGFGRRLGCENCQITSRLDALQPLVRVPAISGTVEISLERLEVADRWPLRLVGTARLLDMPLTLPGQASPGVTGATGSYEVAFKADPVPAGGSIEGVVSDIGGPLQVTARLQLTPPGNYQLAGAVQARPGAHESLASGLALLGPQRAGGGYEFSFAGSL